jgi:hypothetical protein
MSKMIEKLKKEKIEIDGEKLVENFKKEFNNFFITSIG